jgi:hypothetical protein
MTNPGHDHPVMLTAAQAGRITGLLLTAHTLLSALRARGQRGNPATLASFEDLARLTAGGGDASQLIAGLDAARAELAGLMLAAGAR